MDQLVYASLSHTHYWYEVGMLKVPAVIYIMSNIILYNGRLVNVWRLVRHVAINIIII